MRTAIVRITDAVGWVETYTIGEIDITHIYMARWKYDDTPLTEEEVHKGAVYHVAELKGWTREATDKDLYARVWDWLREIGPLDNMTFLQ